jgi:hypothetical protein
MLLAVSVRLEGTMKLRSSVQDGLLAVAAVASAVAVVAGAAGASTGRSSVSITSLTIKGGPSNPVFTITGEGLSVPQPNPKSSPSNQKLCPLTISGNAGLDYGTQFYVLAWPAQANDTNNLLYAAGRYRPSLNELDCVGIVVTSQSPTSVTFTLGHAYVQYYQSKPRWIHTGDVVEVVLKGAAFATVVHF